MYISAMMFTTAYKDSYMSWKHHGSLNWENVIKCADILPIKFTHSPKFMFSSLKFCSFILEIK